MFLFSEICFEFVDQYIVFISNARTYDLKFFQDIFKDIERLIMEITDKDILSTGGDFNLLLEIGDRVKNIKEFCNYFSMEIVSPLIYKKIDLTTTMHISQSDRVFFDKFTKKIICI